jgi:hypothetical protein
MDVMLFHLIAAAISVGGCSLIGLGLGAAGDASKPDYYSFDPSATTALTPGKTYTFLLVNRDSTLGRFIRLDREPSEMYLQEYSHGKGETSVPALSDSLLLTTIRGRELRGSFQGFDYPRLAALRMPDRAGLTKVILDRVTALTDSQGRSFDLKAIITSMNNGKIPIMSNYVIEKETQTIRIPLQDVVEIRQKSKKDGKLTGFLVGAVIDIGIFIAVVVSYSNSTL